jgi:hypothetical protein
MLGSKHNYLVTAMISRLLVGAEQLSGQRFWRWKEKLTKKSSRKQDKIYDCVRAEFGFFDKTFEVVKKFVFLGSLESGDTEENPDC